MKTKGVMLSMLLCAICTAWAGNDLDAEKIRLVEKIYREQGFMKYASPEFKRIVRKGEKIAYRDEPMGCELFVISRFPAMAESVWLMMCCMGSPAIARITNIS